MKRAAVIIPGLLAMLVWLSASHAEAVKWDVLDQTYGSDAGQTSFSKVFKYNWSAGLPKETLAAGKATLTGHTAPTNVFYACLQSIPNLPEDNFTIDLKLAVVSTGSYANLYFSNSGEKGKASMNHVVQINKIYDKPPAANTISDYNHRENAKNVAPADFKSNAANVYRLVRRGGVSSLYLNGIEKPIMEKVAEGAGASGDGQTFVIGFGRPEQEDVSVEVYYLKIATGAHPPGAGDAVTPPAPAAPSADASAAKPAPPSASPSPDWRESLRAKLAKVGGDKQLFIDDIFFDKSAGISLHVNQARETGEIVLKSEKPWESATLNWLNVAEADGKYKMWYECYDIPGWPTGDDTSFCYAESTDGIHWTRPELGLFEYEGSKANNILFRLIGPPGAKSRVHGVGVFIDPQAPSDSRYKAVSQGVFEGVGTPPHRIAGMVSPDGIHWTRLPQPICMVFADSQYSCFWDAGLSKYVLYGRVGGRGRAIGRSESTDFAHFDPLGLVFESDDNDPPQTDVYNPAAVKYAYAENVYMMFPSFYQHVPDTLDIHLAVSRDGTHWTRPEPRVPFIPLGSKDEFDSGSLYMGQGIIRAGDELWQYYGGSRLKHQEGELENLKKPGNQRCYSRVVTKLDRFVSADAGTGGGSFTTIPLTYSGNLLKLNVAVRQGGKVRVALLDEAGKPVDGRSLDDCLPITSDQLDARVTWKNGADVMARAGKPTRLLVEMNDASLYGFQFGIGDAGFGRDH